MTRVARCAATEKVVTFLPLASARSSGSRVRRPVSRTLFIGPIPPRPAGSPVQACVSNGGRAAGPDGRSRGSAVMRILAAIDHPARTRRCTVAYETSVSPVAGDEARPVGSVSRPRRASFLSPRLLPGAHRCACVGTRQERRFPR